MPYYVLPKGIDLPTNATRADEIRNRLSELCSEYARCKSCDDLRAELLAELQTISNSPLPPSYDTRDEARGNCTKGEHVVFVASRTEREGWQQREQRRFATGEYLPAPWSQYDEHAEHYAHLSMKTPGLLAYTKNDEHGIADRQTATKPGRYLAEFYPDTQKSTTDRWIAMCQAHNLELKIARTPADIERVYIGGPASCMGRKRFEECSEHPTRVYGDSDLGVAYYGDIDAASGRCVVWPDRKLYTRIYGGTATLERLLANAGFRQGSIVGAKIRAIWDDNDAEYLMPYVDYIEHASLREPWFILDGTGPYTTQDTGGHTQEGGCYTCSNCAARFRAQDTEDEDDNLCGTCYENNYYCTDCEADYYDENQYSLENGDVLCQSCYDDTLSVCAVCERSWQERDLERTARQARSRNGETDRCVNCVDAGYVQCCDCSDYFNGDTCECQQTEEEEVPDNATV